MDDVVTTSGWKKLSGDITTLQSILDASLDPTCTICKSEKNSILTLINQNKNVIDVSEDDMDIDGTGTSFATSPPETPQDNGTGPFSYKNVLKGTAPFKGSTRQRFSFQSPLPVRQTPLSETDSGPSSPIEEY